MIGDLRPNPSLRWRTFVFLLRGIGGEPGNLRRDGGARSIADQAARQALAISEDCADAWVLLAEGTSTPDAAVERYERAMLAGAVAIGADRFGSLHGEFWGHLETRPYMRARLGLAADADRQSEAHATWEPRLRAVRCEFAIVMLT